jgi:hypothetical protein
METEYLGDYHFFWKSKTERDHFEEKDKFMEMPEWYFGYGYRGRWGFLEEGSDAEPSFPFPFEYPVQVDAVLLKEVRDLLQAIKYEDLPKTVYSHEHFSRDVVQSAMFYRILTYLSIHKELHFGYEQGKGQWIRKSG